MFDRAFRPKTLRNHERRHGHLAILRRLRDEQQKQLEDTRTGLMSLERGELFSSEDPVMREMVFRTDALDFLNQIISDLEKDRD